MKYDYRKTLDEYHSWVEKECWIVRRRLNYNKKKHIIEQFKF